MKKLGLMCLGASFLSVCMMEMHGLKFAAPALLFGGLAVVIAVNIKDRPYMAKNKKNAAPIERTNRKKAAA